MVTLCPGESLTIQEEPAGPQCLSFDPVYDFFLAGSQDGPILYLTETVREVFWHTGQICSTETSGEMEKGDWVVSQK